MSWLDRLLEDQWQLANIRGKVGSPEGHKRLLFYLTTVLGKIEEGGVNDEDWNAVLELADDAGLKEEIVVAREAASQKINDLWTLLNRIRYDQAKKTSK